MDTLFLTGSSGALASAIRDYYLANGWQVAGFDRAASEFSHEQFGAFECNAMEEASVERAFAAAKERFGAPRALIATVGGVRSWQAVQNTSVEDFLFLMNLNLTTFFLASKHAMKLMEGAGSIISIGAEPALTPVANKGAYAASKSAVHTLTRVLAEEGKERGINANVIVPMVIHTKANEEWGSPADIPKWTEPKDIAAMCFMLTSKEGAAVNGSIIRMPNRM